MGRMSAPGWYPDPTGRGGPPRYWDGQRWIIQDSGGSAPAATSRGWLWLVIAVVVIAGLVAAFVLRPDGFGIGIGGGDPNSAKPTGSQWNELPTTETPTEPEDPGNGGIADCPQNNFDYRSEASKDGRMHGGGLSYQPPKGARWDDRPIFMPWLYDHNSMTQSITSQWQSSISVGEVLHSEGFGSAKATAAQLMGCLASSDLYRGFTGREDLLNESFTLDGEEGWRFTAEVLVADQGDIKGDVVDVIVLDLGDAEKLAVFISTATIENEQNLTDVEVATESLRVG